MILSSGRYTNEWLMVYAPRQFGQIRYLCSLPLSPLEYSQPRELAMQIRSWGCTKYSFALFPTKGLQNNHRPWQYDSSSFRNFQPLPSHVEDDHLFHGRRSPLLSPHALIKVHDSANVKIDISSMWTYAFDHVTQSYFTGRLCLR